MIQYLPFLSGAVCKLYDDLSDNIMLKKFVVGVPTDWVPNWVYEETNGQMTSNLGPYIKPIYHDMTYFRGIDFHQDIIDHKSRISDFPKFKNFKISKLGKFQEFQIFKI